MVGIILVFVCVLRSLLKINPTAAAAAATTTALGLRQLTAMSTTTVALRVFRREVGVKFAETFQKHFEFLHRRKNRHPKQHTAHSITWKWCKIGGNLVMY